MALVPTCLGTTRPFPPGAVRSSAIRPLRQSSGQMSPARLPSWVLIWHIGDPPIPVPAGSLALHSKTDCPLFSQSVLFSLLLQWHKSGSARLCIRRYPARGQESASPSHRHLNTAHGSTRGPSLGLGGSWEDPVFHSVQFSSVPQSCLTLCNTMDCSTPGLPVHLQLPEFIQTHVHRVSDAIQSSHPLLSLLLPLIFPSIRVFSNESVLPLRWPKYWSFHFSISPSNEYSGLISFRMD